MPNAISLHRLPCLASLLLVGSFAGTALSAAEAPPSHAGCPMMQTTTPSARGGGAALSEAGQDTFAALAEAANRLEDDPGTDWSHANLLALREHLVDMSELFVNAEVVETPIPGGVVARVTGAGRTLAAIQRMTHMHAMHPPALPWQAATVDLPDGVEVRLTSEDPKEIARIRALGFFGYLASGDHHRVHHWMLARGEAMSH